MAKVRILGISGSPVLDGNCDKLVKHALQAAEEIDGIETEFIPLANKEIAMCKHCQYCMNNRTGCQILDDAQPIFERIKACDGLIIGAPTWLRTVCPIILNLFSRARSIMFITHEFRNKVSGALTLGWFGRGMDIATLEIMHITSRFMMIPVAEGMATSSKVALGERADYMEHGVLDDPAGVIQTRNVGYRVAEVAKMIKHAIESGEGVPPEYQITTSGGTVRRKKSS
ncbi:flavodoxin family protein [Chloroflexota bacterium]